MSAQNRVHEDDDDLLTIEQAMRKLKCGRTKIYELAHGQRLELRKFGGQTRITARSVTRLIRQIRDGEAS